MSRFRVGLGGAITLVLAVALPAQEGPRGFGPPGFGGPGFGPPPGMGPGSTRKIVEKFDQNQDGWLNATERQAAREFLKKEPAGRGPGGPGGFGPGGPGRGRFGPGGFLLPPMLAALDADKDGKLSANELAAGARQLFAVADEDKREKVAESQLIAAVNKLAPPPPGPGGFPGGRVPGNPVADGIIRRADANRDGAVTLAELQTAATAAFQEFDKDQDARLDESELQAAFAAVVPPPQFGPGGPGGPGGPSGPGGPGRLEPGKPGPRVALDDPQLKAFPAAPLYEPSILRTLFLEFEEPDWEAALQEFRDTDIEVPAMLIVDGRRYPQVGVRFRGMSSYRTVPAGSKRSLNVSLDLVNAKQRLYGYKTLNLLNAHDDPSFLSTVLYSRIASRHIPTPQANFVKVVINGESWGVYANVQQFNKEFVVEHFGSSKGTRWKVRGSPGAASGLEFTGENLDDYKRRFEMKSDDGDKEWKSLVELCRTLAETPADKLEQALQPMLAIDEVLWFLALDVSLINNDGYWVRASDYSLFRDPKGQFSVIPHDMNEAFHGAMFGPPGFGGPGGRGPGGPGGREPGGPDAERRGSPVELDPLIGLNDARKPLRSKLLAVPALRTLYLEHVRTIAEQDLDWKQLGPIVAGYRSLIEAEIAADTRKLGSLDAFRRATADTAANDAPVGRPQLSLRAFADQRRKYLLNYPAIRDLKVNDRPANDRRESLRD